MKSKHPAIFSAAVLLSLGSAALLAQPATRPVPPQPAVPPGLGVAPGLQAPTEHISQEQRNKMRELTEGMRKQSQEHTDRQRQLRTELEALVRAEPIDEAAIRAKAVEMGKVEGELAVIRAKYMVELKKVLPEGAVVGQGASPVPQPFQGARPKGAPPVPEGRPAKEQKPK